MNIFNIKLNPYNHIIGYLHRWTILNNKWIHIRVHKILSEDKTPFLHNHPFSYISIILSGGYREVYKNNKGNLIEKEYSKFSVIVHTNKTYHRILSVKENTKTLFFTLKSKEGWNLEKYDKHVS